VRLSRRVGWLLFGVLVIVIIVAATAQTIADAISAGTAARIVAAGLAIGTFVFAWRAFRRSHGDVLPTTAPRKIPNRWARWGPVLGVVLSATLLNFRGTVQLLGLAVIVGFMWPALYWIIRSFLKHPQRRERLWNGRAARRDGVIE
jgi:hypothetical protein